MNTIFKQAEEADWEAFRSIRLRALRSDPSVFGSNRRKEATKTESDWKDLLKTEDMAVFLIYEDTSLIGMTGIVVDRNDPTSKTAYFGVRGSNLALEATACQRYCTVRVSIGRTDIRQ